MKYTFTFSYDQTSRFEKLLAQLDPSEYKVIKSVDKVDPSRKFGDVYAILDIDPEACLTFRLGMKQLVIQRERSEAELAEEQKKQEAVQAEAEADHKKYVARVMQHQVEEVGPVISIGGGAPEDLVINIGTGKVKGPKKDEQS
jgi:hypothetical protein